jgi:flavin-dependent dehydrogenase
VPLWDKPLAVACPSGGHIHAAAPATDAGIFRVGDRLAHIPPFTGDGLAIALGSAALAARHIGAGASSADYERAARRLVAPPLRWARAVSWLTGCGAGRTLLGSAARAPGLLRAVARATRLADARL